MLADEAMPVDELERAEGETPAAPTRKRRWRRWTRDDPVEEELALERVQSARAHDRGVDGLLTGH